MQATMTRSVFSPYQMQILEAVSHVNSDKEMRDIRDMIANYFEEKAQRELDKLWDSGQINDDVIETWAHEHMRIKA